MEKNQETMTDSQSPRVAIVHDFLVTLGGAERVVGVLAEMFPKAPIYTLLYDSDAAGSFLSGRDIRPSFLQKLPRWIRRRYRWLLPLFPAAVEAFDLRDFDVVISSSGAWSKGIVTRLDTKHIAYIHSPMRYVWDYNERYVREVSGKRFGLIKRALLCAIRVWDAQAADRPDVLIANSEYTRDRIAKYYRRESTVVYPPVVTDGVRVSSDRPGTDAGVVGQGYFLLVSRLTKVKKVDAVIDAFNKLELPLIVVGRGSEEARLRRLAGKTVRIVGWKSDQELSRLYAGARALVFPSEEDFGLVIAEALGHGVPVIALGRGGAREIIQEGVTGEFFEAATPAVIADGVRRFLGRESEYDRDILRRSVDRFSRERFKTAFQGIVDKVTVSQKVL